MWALHESYDPAAKVLYVDLLTETAVPEPAPGAPPPTLLGTFSELDDAHQFLEDYLKRVAHDARRVVRRVDCGSRQADGWAEGPPA